MDDRPEALRRGGRARSPSTWAIPGTRARRRYTSPYFVTEPEFTSYDVNDRYTLDQVPRLRRQALRGRRALPHPRGLQAQRAVRRGAGRRAARGPRRARQRSAAAQSTLGRTAVRQIESLYIAGLMKEWVGELVEAVKGGDSEYFREPATITGSGTGFWEAPRGALYHSEKVRSTARSKATRSSFPTTWNARPAQCQRGERTRWRKP